ncbi:MAG: hypothetical protein RMY33_014160 [Nostoc sp. DedQUE03]|nr:hypothetical protein [Nostoc sp. DedQUE02]
MAIANKAGDRFLWGIECLMKFTPNKKFALKHFYHEKSMLSLLPDEAPAQLLLIENA